MQEIIAGLKELPAHHWTGNKIILAGILCEPEEVLDILEEMPVVEEVTGRPEIAFTGAAAEHVTFATERKPSSLMCRWKFRNTAWSALWGAAAAVNPPY